jgi:peptidoglycan hydrolase CwlO-like protein
MSKYTIKTIVANEAVRNEFTALRDSLNSSDKELMQAFWNLGIDRLEDIKNEVKMLQDQAALERQNKKEVKAAAKRKPEGEDKPKAKRGRKPKAETEKVAKPAKKAAKVSDAPNVNTNEVVTEVLSEDGEEPITVVVSL